MYTALTETLTTSPSKQTKRATILVELIF